MRKWAEKILIYNPGEKSLKAPFAIYLGLECLSKKKNLAKKIPKNLVGQCLQYVHLMEKKINLIITEEKIVFKNCVKS